MLFLKIILIIAVVLILIGFIPVKLWGEFSGEGPKAAVKILIFRIPLYPKKEKPEGEASEKKKEKKDKKKKDKDDEEEPKEKKVKTGGKLEFFRELIGMGLEALGCLKRKLVLDDLVMKLTVGCKNDDPAAAAILYGRAWAAIGNVLPRLENFMKVKDRDLSAEVNFEQEETLIYASAVLYIRIGSVIKIAVHYGIKALKIYLRYRKNRKAET